jgi:very-short-patch-repair endonuclease
VGTISAPSDRELARLAGPLRIVRLDQLRAAGVSDKAIRHRVAHGRLQRLWPGVFLVGPGPAGALSLALGATSSFTGDVYVSNAWAAFVRGFAPPPELPVDVLVATGTRSARPRIRIHRSEKLLARDVGLLRGIPVTSAARAILDCAETRTPSQVEALIADAHAARAVTEAELQDVLSRAGPRKAGARLAAVLSEQSGLTLSEAERILRRLLKKAGLPQPQTNYAIGRYKADFAWPRHALVVEFDSWAHHGHRKAFRHDRKRNGTLAAKGWSVLPITYEQLRDEPFAVVALIAEALARRAA